MEGRSWPWSKKASAKVRKTASFKGTPPSVTVDEERPHIDFDNASVLEAVALREQAEEKVKSLMEKLTSVLGDLTAKEDLVKQHGKVAEDAVSGWEKAEVEAQLFKKELEASILQRRTAEDHVVHLDGALKECMRQVRLARDEQEQKIQAALSSKTREWEKIKLELDATQAELAQRLMESDAQNGAMTKTLQERTKTIVEVKEEKARAETEVKLLQVKVNSLEKEIAALKYELHVLNKELEIRNEEREYSRKSAEAAHKQHLENAKKIAKLESECQKLRTLVRKKLPGPAALGQMRMEIEGLGRDVTSDWKRRNSFVSSKGFPSPPSAGSKYQNRDQAAKEVQTLTERMLSMEEETKLLKEALTKKSDELQAARQLCARTATKLSVAEDQLESLQGTPRKWSNGIDLLQTERNLTCKSEDANVRTDDEVSCAESWASALIHELAQFRKNKGTSRVSRQSMESSNFDATEEFFETERDAALVPSPTQAVHSSTFDQGSNTVENQQLQVNESMNQQEPRILKTTARDAEQLQAACLSCKEVNRKLCLVEEQLQVLKSQRAEDTEMIPLQVQESLRVIFDARQVVSKLDGLLDDMQIGVSVTEENEAREANSGVDRFPANSVSKGQPVAKLRIILCKLIMLLEMLLQPRLPSVASHHGADRPNSHPSLTHSSTKLGKPALLQFEQRMQDLVTTKEKCLQCKASLPEFLLRLGVLLSGLCDTDSSDLENLLSEELTVLGTDDDKDKENLEGGGEAGLAELLSCSEAKAMELEKQLSATDEELKRTSSELAETKELVTDLQVKITELQRAEKKMSEEEESMRAELPGKAEERVRELEENVASLRAELEEQRKQYEGAVAKCEELEDQLSRFANLQRANSRRQTDDEQARLKERELTIAKEKLAECQRTIVALGKQLTALSSPLAHSPATSFDSTSMGSGSIDRRVLSAGEFTDDMQPSSRFATNRDCGQIVQIHHHRRRPPLSFCSEPPYEYEPALRWSPSRSCYVQESGLCVPNHPQRHNRHIVSDFRSGECGNGVLSQLSPIDDYPDNYLDQLAVTVYSPPHNQSPATLLQLNAQRNSGNSVRANLTKSMDRAASVSMNSIKPAKAANTSIFRRFFSRSKNHSGSLAT